MCIVIVVVFGVVIELVVGGERGGAHDDILGFLVMRQVDGDRWQEKALFASTHQGLAYGVGVWDVTLQGLDDGLLEFARTVGV